jgi:hypothetical protein
MRILVLNATNVVDTTLNSTLVYKFPNSVLFKGNSIAVSSISLYYSWYNISASLGNNIIQYTWTVAGVTTTYTVTIPDGLYEIDALNAFLQFTMIQNGHYLIDSSNDNVYYLELIVNPSRYAIQLNTFLVPTVLPATYTAPAGFAGFPTVAQNPVVTFPSSFNEIVGYVAGFQSNANVGNAYVPPVSQYVSKLANGTLSYISTTSPNVQPNSSLYVSCSGINNPYSQPSSIIYSMTPSVAIGGLITEKPPNFVWNKLIDGTYNELRVTFLGTNLQPIKLNDNQITILLAIKDGDEIGLK